MADDLVEFVVDGSSERNGAIPAEAFLAKLRAFVSAVYSFERAFTHKDKRQIDLEIIDLSRHSPARIAMKPRSRANGYVAGDAMQWTFEQLELLYAGKPIDPSVPQSAIESIIDLASVRVNKMPELGIMRAKFNGKVIEINSVLENRARALRAQHYASIDTPWRAGISRGSLFGELKGVTDFDGERQFYIFPPSGPERVQCVFSEALRPKMNQYLFSVVRAGGFLHYKSTSPHPFLLDADTLDGVKPQEGHFRDLKGLFQGEEIDESSGEWAL